MGQQMPKWEGHPLLMRKLLGNVVGVPLATQQCQYISGNLEHCHTHLPEHKWICYRAVIVLVSFNLNLERTLSGGHLGTIEAKNIQCSTMHCSSGHLR